MMCDFELVQGGTILDHWNGRIGLRTIALDRHPDEFGESFQFVVNGRLDFCQGRELDPCAQFRR